MYDYLIVGAGLYGAVFANEMAKRNKKCLVIEKRNHIAGNAYTEKADGITLHKYGAHIFHTDNDEIWQYVNRFAKFKPFINSPLANYHGEIYPLPFNMHTFEKLWGVKTAEEAKLIIESQTAKYKSQPVTNLEMQALCTVGDDVYEKLIKGYTEKQWGRSCRELPPEILKRIPVRYTYDNNYFTDKYQGIPQNGYTDMVANMLEGVPVLVGTDYFDYIKSTDNTFGKVVFCGAIDKFFDYKFGKLEYRSLRFETEKLNEADHQHNAVINFTSAEVPYTRTIEHKHFLAEQSPVTYVTREYPAKSDDEPYYPINDAKNGNLYKKYAELARHTNVIFGGRLGEYRYYDMDKVIAAALERVKNEL